MDVQPHSEHRYAGPCFLDAELREVEVAIVLQVMRHHRQWLNPLVADERPLRSYAKGSRNQVLDADTCVVATLTSR